MAKDIKCTCGHSWNKSDSSKKDMHVCHICGKDNTMEDGGWLNKFDQGGMVLEQKDDNYGKKPNPNDVQASVGPDFVGLGYNTKGRNYSPAWGGQFQSGGIIVTDPKDPKLKKYQDSLNLYNKNKKIYESGIETKSKGLKYENAIKGRPYGEKWYLEEGTPFDVVKKPVQPVVYKKPEREPVIVNDPKDPRLKAYQDSLKLYGLNPSRSLLNKAIKEGVYKNANPQTVKGNIKPVEYYKADINVMDKLKEKPYTYFSPEITKENYSKFYEDEYGVIRDRKTGEKVISNVNMYKKPVQPVEYKKAEEIKSIQPTPRGSKKYIVNDIEVSEEDFLSSGATTGGGKRVMYNTPKQGERKVLRLDGTPETDPDKIRRALATANKKEEFQMGGGILGKTFLQPNDPKLPVGWNPKEKGYSTEYSTTIGKDGEYYLVPGFKHRKLVSDPEKEFRNTGELLGGPFKTIQSAQDFADRRHKYVEQGKPLPSPIKTYDYLKFAMGGSMPGAVGFTYARVAGSAPSNGKYAKKTKASAQNGKEMKFYQEGLDFKPNNISEDGAIIDPMGQWAHPGEVTIIPSTDITMEGVDYPVLGISDTGDQQMMYPGEDYDFDGEYVTEYPMMKEGGWLNKYQGGGKLNKPTLKEISQIKEKRYEPSDAVKNMKAALSATDLSTIPFAGNPIGFAVNRMASIANSVGDAYTAARYAIDGQWKNAGIDATEAVLDLVPFRKGRLSKLDKSSNKALKIGKGMSYADDFQDVAPKQKNGGWLNKYK